MSAHTRIRPFNTRDTYPEPNLDNDLCQAVVAGGVVYLRGQIGQDLDTRESVGVGDGGDRRDRRDQRRRAVAMTFSLVARDPDTGAFGVVICSSSPAVASRCAYLRAGVGAVSTQNVTNPELGPRALDVLAEGADAERAVKAVLAQERFPDHRQLIVVDGQGNTAVHTGGKALGIHHQTHTTNAAAAGRMR